MISLDKIPDLTRRAYHLAYFIHVNKAKAFEIASNALLQLSTTVAAQEKKRDAYAPKIKRTKVIMGSHEQLLQRLVYYHSEPVEKGQERSEPHTLSEEDLLIRFIEHLVKTSIGRNSFYATVAVCRLLFPYSIEGTRKIFEGLMPNPKGIFPADDAYSKRKAKLIEGLQARFGDLIEVIRAARNDQHLQFHPNPERFEDVTRDSLEMFTPWMTDCFPDTATLATIERELWFEGEPDEEHLVELKRMHIIIHCLDRFTKLLKLMKPRLAVPQFIMASAGDDHNGSQNRTAGKRTTPPPLEETELDQLAKELAREQRRRKFSFASLLKIYVDGCEHTDLDLNRQPSKEFQVKGDAQIIEIRAGRVLLATFFLPLVATTQSVELEGRQKLICDIDILTDHDGEVTSANVKVKYQETNPLRVAARWWLKILHFVSFSPLRKSRPAASGRSALSLPLRIVGAATMVALLIWIILNWEPARHKNEIVTVSSPAPSLASTPYRPSVGPSPESSTPILALNDGRGQVTLDTQGKLTGLETLSSIDQQRVKVALTTQKAETPSALKKLGSPPETVSRRASDSSFSLLSPVSKIVMSNLPTLRWQPLSGATRYRVRITDPEANYKEIALSPTLSNANWQVDRPLARGRIYAWQVSAQTDSGEVKSPLLNAPEARFKILEQTKAEETAWAKKAYAGRPLLLGLFYARVGLLDEAERELEALVLGNPKSPVAQNLLSDIRAKQLAR